MKHYFIINSKAGKGDRAKEFDEKIRDACESRGVEYEIYNTLRVGDATDFVKSVCSRPESLPARFYACGGDGTLCEVVNGAVGADGASVGVVPIGTGNDFVRNFGSAEAFFDIGAQLDGETMDIDVLKCNEKYAVNMINIGFDCEVVKKTAKLKKNPLISSKLAYAAGVVSTLIKKPGVKAEISRDGEKSVVKKYLLTTFANGSFCGGGFHSNPFAELSDGKIDALFINDISRTKFITLIGSYKKGTHITEKNKDVLSSTKCGRIILKFASEQGVSVDGEITNFKEICIESIARALNFIVPAGAALSVKRCNTGEASV